MLKDILSVQVLLKSYGKERGLDVKEAAEIKRLGPMQRRMSAIGVTADNGVFWPAMVCLLLTQQRHHLCTAAMLSMPVSASIEVLV